MSGSGFEFAVPIASVGSDPRVVVWQDEDFIRIRVQSSIEVAVSPIATAEASLIPGSAGGARGAPAGDWSSDGVTLPEYTELKFNYDGETYEGAVIEGMLAFGENARHKSPSGAMMAAIRERTGKSVNVNGWNYVTVLIPGAKSWVILGQMRTTVKRRG